MKVLSINKAISLELNNRKELIAGLVLNSQEVKSIRNHVPSLKGTYCSYKKNELFLINFNLFNAVDRPIKLLLHRKEINKIINYPDILVKELLEINGFFKIKIIAGKKEPLDTRKKFLEQKKREAMQRENF